MNKLTALENELKEEMKRLNSHKSAYEFTIFDVKEGELSGIQKAKDIFIEILDGDKIYPKDIFPELSEFQLQTINDLCISNLRFPIDRLSAHVSRLILNKLKQSLEGGK